MVFCNAVHHQFCHCEEAQRANVGPKGMPVVQSPGTILVTAAQIGEWYQEIATSLRSSQ